MAKRREFLKVAFAAGVGATFFASCSGDEKKACSKKNYSVVASWPKAGDQITEVGVTGVTQLPNGHILYSGGDIANPMIELDKEGNLVRKWGGDVITLKHEVRCLGDKIFITDIGSHQIHQFDLKGNLLQSWGVKNEPGTDHLRFNKPTDIALAPSGDYYVSDGYKNNRVVCLDKNGKYKFEWGQKGVEPGQFNIPHNIGVDRKGHVYVADRKNARVQVFELDGKFVTSWDWFSRPFGIFVADDGNIYVSDGGADKPQCVSIVTPEGKVLQTIGSTGSKKGQFDIPHSLYVANDGALFVAEGTNKRVQKFVIK
ncbi:peptidyl-alpha-hydroxyglycine alpha-amidating lyase family protein [Halosquirtibacter laminarini]|uniref:Peptidyl-alpha-hydroxyglycine alpha-amidating lyase family protein n=1 Tax=Halosquirtibacter laminarini TaxID=3374600 RepID=A0AC61NIR3_9BACT|nr:peptidyl-alpha-hydroxyglycine alpha-amidating lyase family protein [Prolixibacteraceae bacterium]